MDETLSPDDPRWRSEAPRPHLVVTPRRDDDDDDVEARTPRERFILRAILAGLALFLLGFTAIVSVAYASAHSSRDIHVHVPWPHVGR